MLIRYIIDNWKVPRIILPINYFSPLTWNCPIISLELLLIQNLFTAICHTFFHVRSRCGFSHCNRLQHSIMNINVFHPSFNWMLRCLRPHSVYGKLLMCIVIQDK
ncbi:putative uncharacterized protein [Moritella viscosa]|nr:putative uncharacterized protein [Moritella viscosa]